jgi:hypothetical protein
VREEVPVTVRTHTALRRGKHQLGLAVVALAAACSAAYLEQPPPPPVVSTPTTVAVSGSFCTDDPKALLSPVKVLFLLDYSQSMLVSDPQTQRAEAVAAVMDRLGKSPGLWFGILLFRGDVNVLTKKTLPDGSQLDGFASSLDLDTAQIRAALGVGLSAPTTLDQQTTDFVGVLSRARDLIQTDLIEGQADPDQLARTKYVVVLLSDGIPTMNYVNSYPGCQPGGVGGNACPLCLPVIQDQVVKIQRLQNLGAGLVKLNTAYVFNNPEAPPPPPSVHRAAAALLDCMAVAGNGEFRDFAAGEPIDFLGFDFQALQRLYKLQSLLVVNVNARPGTFAPDSDGDGLSDAEELALGSNPLLEDTDGDGYGDLLESRYPQNFHLTLPDPGCPPEARGDRDGDGLRDCEELYIGTGQSRIDTDRDGAPDGIEWKMGTRPTSDDSQDDPDRDGLSNLQELRAHTDPNKPELGDLADVAQRQTLQSHGFPIGGRMCTDFRVENVHLAETLDRGQGAGWNDIWVTAAQVPFDAPGAAPVYKVARVQARLRAGLREPADGELHVPFEAFAAPAGLPAPTAAAAAGLVRRGGGAW